MKSHVRNTVRSVLRKGRSRGRSRSRSFGRDSSPLRSDADFVYTSPDTTGGLGSSSHHRSPSRYNNSHSRSRQDYESVPQSAISQSPSRIFSSHHRGRSGRDVGSKRDGSTDSDRGSEATTAGRWPRRILSRVSRRSRVEDSGGEEDESWRPFGRRKSRKQKNGLSGSTSSVQVSSRFDDEDEEDEQLAVHTRMNASRINGPPPRSAAHYSAEGGSSKCNDRQLQQPSRIEHDDRMYPKRQTDRLPRRELPSPSDRFVPVVSPPDNASALRSRQSPPPVSESPPAHPKHASMRNEWSPESLGGNGTPGTESTRATEESPCRDYGNLQNDSAEEAALCYSPADSPSTPPLITNGVQSYSPVETLQSTSETAGAIPPGALSAKGTPTDLTQFFYPKPWTPERFKSLKRLASAIHGEVRYVLDMVEKKSVVVKVIRNNAVRPRGPGELENPLVEIGAMTYLHSNWAVFPVDMVAKLENVYQDPNYTYLVTEYCSEGELFREVVARKSLSERHVKAIALQLAIALFSLHKNGICHRDVSLENTLVQRDRSVRLIDFGQAEAIYDAAGAPRLMTGSAGKAYYRAPEMLRGSYYGPPVDVFALGVEIFIMAVGSPPWQKANLQDARYRNLTKCPTALDVALRKWGKRALLSDAFVDILASIFCSEPNDRPTIEELLYHPWFAFDSGIWRWVHGRKCSRTIRFHAERVERFLQLHPQGKYFERPCSVNTGADRPSLGPAGSG